MAVERGEARETKSKGRTAQRTVGAEDDKGVVPDAQLLVRVDNKAGAIVDGAHHTAQHAAHGVAGGDVLLAFTLARGGRGVVRESLRLPHTFLVFESPPPPPPPLFPPSHRTSMVYMGACMGACTAWCAT